MDTFWWVLLIIGTTVLLCIVLLYDQVRRTKGPQERAFVIRTQVVSGLVAGLLVYLVSVLPSPYTWVGCTLLVAFCVLPNGFIRKRQASIRRQEAEAKGQSNDPAQPEGVPNGHTWRR